MTKENNEYFITTYTQNITIIFCVKERSYSEAFDVAQKTALKLETKHRKIISMFYIGIKEPDRCIIPQKTLISNQIIW